MIVVGEETGSLTAMLDKAADIYDEEVDNLSSRLTTLIEPALVIIVGAIVCAILLSVFAFVQGVRKCGLAFRYLGEG